MKEIFHVNTKGKSKEAAVVQGEKYRITMLTDALVRLEYSEDGKFEDRASQCVLNRDFPVPEFRVLESEESLEILTGRLQLIYNKREFTDYGLSIQVRGNISAYHSVWHFGEEIKDLGGDRKSVV